jgi:uncharacterized protein
MVNLSFVGCPVVDAHCHPFLPDKETRPFEAYLTLSDIPQRMEDLKSTMLYRLVMRELGQVMRLRGDEKIIAERQRRIKGDPSGYIQMLFDEAGLETLLVDSGYPFKEFVGYEIYLEDFSKMIGREVREIFRLEVAVHGLLKGLVPYDQAVEDFRSQIGKAISGGCIALKSVIAYRTGLAVRSWEEGIVKRSWGEMVSLVRDSKKPSAVLSERNERNKSVYDSFLMIGVEEARRLAVPLQIHTGMGDSPSMDLRIADPSLLYDLLQNSVAREASIVLTHGGYPYMEEAAFLANAYPNVYIDLSETIPIVSVGLRSRLLSLFEMAPITKIMYGSDGFNIPELYWFSAVYTKRALASVLGELVRHDGLGETDAVDIGKSFLAGNARRLYRL